MNRWAVLFEKDLPALDVAGVLVLVQEVFVIGVNVQLLSGKDVAMSMERFVYD